MQLKIRVDLSKTKISADAFTSGAGASTDEAVIRIVYYRTQKKREEPIFEQEMTYKQWRDVFAAVEGAKGARLGIRRLRRNSDLQKKKRKKR